MIRALIFDFDGLILETEGPIIQSWRELYQAHNCKLEIEQWLKVIGGAVEPFDPFASLEAQLGRPIDREALQRPRRQREMELVRLQPLRPGVLDYLQAARQMGLKTGVASSSPEPVEGHLEWTGILGMFDCIKTSNDVDRIKPAPDLYLAAAACLGVQPNEALALEDSHHGVVSAKRAGLVCVAVPNEMTRSMDFSPADLQLDSLANLPLEALLDRYNQTPENEP